MVTTRGCPWHCGYCSQVYSEKLRFRSVELVVDEMEHLEYEWSKKAVWWDVAPEERWSAGIKAHAW